MRLNGQLVLPALSDATHLQPLHATSFKLPVLVRNGQGIVLDFQATTGETILNGLQVKRVL